MITLTRLNGRKVIINVFLIEMMEETPDTVITLTTGNKIVVLEKASDVISLVQKYMRSIGALNIAVKSQDLEGS
jgi:flagellar protein FlbD